MEGVVGFGTKRVRMDHEVGAGGGGAAGGGGVIMGGGVASNIGVAVAASGGGGQPPPNGMGNLPGVIGTGVHQQPLMLGVLQAIRTLNLEVTDLRMAAYRFWEGPVDWKYVTNALLMKKEYGKACSEAKGTRTKVGAIKNWLMAAFT